METVDWEISSGEASDNEASLQDISYDDEKEHYSKSWFTSKLQFRKDKSKAHWIDEIGMAKVVETRGGMWRTMGIVRGGQIYYSFEETLFLIEIGALLLLDDKNTSLSLRDIYAKVGGASWAQFEVYRHLKSLGYIVGRHGVSWSMKGAKSNSHSLSHQGSSESSELIDAELKQDNSIIGPFNDLHITEARPVFDLFLPNSKFRKSCTGEPSFVLCLTRGDVPSIADVEVLEKQCGGIPLLFCYVEYGQVSFFSFDEVELPVLP